MKLADFLVRMTDDYYEKQPHGRVLRVFDETWSVFVIHLPTGAFMPAGHQMKIMDIISHVTNLFPEANLVDFLWTSDSKEALEALIKHHGEPPSDPENFEAWCRKVAQA